MTGDAYFGNSWLSRKLSMIFVYKFMKNLKCEWKYQLGCLHCVCWRASKDLKIGLKKGLYRDMCRLKLWFQSCIGLEATKVSFSNKHVCPTLIKPIPSIGASACLVSLISDNFAILSCRRIKSYGFRNFRILEQMEVAAMTNDRWNVKHQRKHDIAKYQSRIISIIHRKWYINVIQFCCPCWDYLFFPTGFKSFSYIYNIYLYFVITIIFLLIVQIMICFKVGVNIVLSLMKRALVPYYWKFG